MRIAFYAPMKPPDHPTPSGDVRVARLLIAALRQAGNRVELASRLRTWDGVGDEQRQERLAKIGARSAERLIQRYRRAPRGARPDLWFTYHLYHKAPDWLGPAVAEALEIPYVVAEASYAPKRAGGPWDRGHRAVAQALGRADVVFHLNTRDSACVDPLLKPGARAVRLPPFLDVKTFSGPPDRTPFDRLGIERNLPVLLAVGMMRMGDKLASYRMLGTALGQLLDRPWSLVVVGDGPARAEVEKAFGSLPAARVRFVGAVKAEALPPYYHAADLFVWPAVNEAFGMAILEAQAAGLPVVAGQVGGVPGIVEDGSTAILAPPGDARAFADAVALLLDEPRRRRAMSAAARARAARVHDLAAAARALDAALRPLVKSAP
ncbi:MAG: glycosyltransferase family 4 protein [Candidatus Eiseniibacteriota bacterium]